MDFLKITDISKEKLHSILQLAAKLKEEHKSGKINFSLAGKTLALLMEKPSTRTLASFQIGMAQLGGQTTVLSSSVSQLSRGEPFSDTGAILGSYCDIIAARLHKHTDLEELANATSTPVINALTDLDHPCQALAALLTMKENGKLFPGAKFVFAGDCGFNVANALMGACALEGMDITLACPQECAVNKEYLKFAQSHSTVKISHDLLSAAKDADIIYTDTWVSMGQEEEKEKRMQLFLPFQVNSATMHAAKKDAIFMHDLPAYRGKEVTSDVIDGPQSTIYAEAENRLHVQKALMLHLLGKA
ncbi:Ornithine carbamoyltransferase [Candidatus Anstonella stagnisolia]|nr:Ornithine carbamoyltransferase [Candidatus Anstonella stagnisolia]